tara:strand:- start:966 stop:1109 length:144 start_codon:yes stop_codon:yes gene_type:complete
MHTKKVGMHVAINIENNEMNVRLLLRQMLRQAIFKISKNFIIMACSE